jgi:hypothetical protein
MEETTIHEAENAVVNERISEAFAAIIDWAASLGAVGIKDLPGCWEHDLGEFHIAINGHAEEIACSNGMDVEPYGVLVVCNGWPYAMLNAYHGIIMSQLHNAEDELIDAFRKATP